MSVQEQFTELCKDFPAFRKIISKYQQTASDSATRDFLGSLLDEMDRAYAQVQQLVPAAISDIKSSAAEVQKSAMQLIQENLALQDKIAASEAALAAAAEAGPPKPPELQIDPHWPHELVTELLGKYGLAQREKAQEYGDLWDYYDRDEQT